jgi:hypothetical protein
MSSIRQTVGVYIARGVHEEVDVWVTCSISAELVIFFDMFFKKVTTCSTARSIPRFKSIGFMPAATDLQPSL